MKRMIQTTAALALGVLLSGPAMASSDDIDAAKQEQIRTELTAQGYEVRKIAMEDGMIEAYVLKDGKKMELYLDADLKIIDTKTAD